MIDKERLEAHLNNGKREYIMCAANYYDDGKDYIHKPFNIDKGYIVCGWRHPHCGTTYIAASGDDTWDSCVQGFFTNKNRFLTRDEGRELARENGQVDKDFNRILTSEDMW